MKFKEISKHILVLKATLIKYHLILTITLWRRQGRYDERYRDKGSLHLGARTDSLRVEIPPWISSTSSCTIFWTLPHKKSALISVFPWGKRVLLVSGEVRNHFELFFQRATVF